tara:strand:- start:9732 stop:10007 length:276 start_codon:yes stop_codon:yes gene_type:complete
MVEVTLDGYKYNYHKSEEGPGYWTGASGYNGSMGRYPNCRVPTCLWVSLRKKALEEGYSEEEFKAPVKEKKRASRTSNRSSNKNKNSISIF